MPRDEVVEVRHVREHVVAEQQVGLAALGRQRARPLDAEELARASGCPSLGHRGDVRRRLDAEHRHAALHEVLQQVAVVGRDLDDQAGSRRGRSARPSPRRSARSASSQLSEYEEK